MDYKKPTPSLVQEKVKEHEQDLETVDTDTALTLLIQTFPKNQAIHDVLLKVAAINQLYSAGLKTTAIYGVSKLIRGLDIDPKLAQGSLDVVDEIAYGLVAGENDRYAFATKYCHWHRPDFYPICDTNARDVLRLCKEVDAFADFRLVDFYKYPLYKGIIEAFVRHYGLSAFSFRQLDKFLWRYNQ
ncbi:MAG: hypothetical protein C5B59_00460 [Bacteroidetes bacterium]|nr:MAG: hypothetical protein C5B59_00460 [Bacteroidota bacterium]